MQEARERAYALSQVPQRVASGLSLGDMTVDQRRSVRVIPHLVIDRCCKTLTATFGRNS
ncbi:hypothetical protein BOS5A_210532 [Bosea sp. EC-HK365B]|nr:hypothetical protein BOSE7B_120394 [Bosea sp. 7B]CAD5278721.1 hypothetical protein BOSE46_40163 [Bosea sp. 46]VVT59741.1 hypothetical protein BOS5A_210532 [Bosea sp. EC-HK365B]VXC02968.1 hypothetical protein BOSE127_170032 [Bosea sp. 127]